MKLNYWSLVAPDSSRLGLNCDFLPQNRFSSPDIKVCSTFWVSAGGAFEKGRQTEHRKEELLVSLRVISSDTQRATAWTHLTRLQPCTSFLTTVFPLSKQRGGWEEEKLSYFLLTPLIFPHVSLPPCFYGAKSPICWVTLSAQFTPFPKFLPIFTWKPNTICHLRSPRNFLDTTVCLRFHS